MLATSISSLVVIVNLNIAMAKPPKTQPDFEPIGSHRVTYYCPSCNSPSGSKASSSGKTLKEGHVACSWLPLGTKIKIEGKTYEVVDRCGTDAIDIFIDTPNCKCNQNGTYTTEVKRKVR